MIDLGYNSRVVASGPQIGLSADPWKGAGDAGATPMSGCQSS